MEQTCTKSGFLQKAGKHTFQAWRKRWFVLSGDDIKYYNSAVVCNENHLGTINMVNVQSVVDSKEKKYSFRIITTGRTYYVAAKTAEERSDWILSIRTNLSFVKQTNSADTHIYAEVGMFSNSTNKKITTGCNSKKRACSLIPSQSGVLTNSGPKSRSLSEGYEVNLPKKVGVHSLLQDMSIDEEVENEVESITSQLDDAFDGGYTTGEDGDEEVIQPEDYHCQFRLPKPRGGETKYAFEEIRKLSLLFTDNLFNVELDELAKLTSLKVDLNAEYPAINLLDSFLAT